MAKAGRVQVALTATIYNFDVELADADRQVYESLALRMARYPSESEEYLVARLLAYLLESAEGIEFSRGVSDPDEPAIVIRDPHPPQSLTSAEMPSLSSSLWMPVM